MFQETVPAVQNPMLAFSFYYNAALHELTVLLIRGKRINGAEELENSSHILISVVVIPEGSIQHSSRGIPPNPLFKERFTFFINGDELKISKVKFNVWKVDKYSRKLPFGEIVVNMSDVFKDDVIKTSCVEDIWKEIEPKEKLVSSPSFFLFILFCCSILIIHLFYLDFLFCLIVLSYCFFVLFQVKKL